MKEQIKEAYGDDIKLALQASIESEITSPTTRAKLEWALGEIERLELVAESEYARGYDDGYDDGDAAGYAAGANDDW